MIPKKRDAIYDFPEASPVFSTSGAPLAEKLLLIALSGARKGRLFAKQRG